MNGATDTALISLTRWGFSAYADLVYRALSLAGPSEARALSQALGIPAARIRSALSDLHSASVVTASGRTPRYVWQAVPVSEAAGILNHAKRARRRTEMPRADLPVPLGAEVVHHPTRAGARLRAGALVNIAKHEWLTINPEQRFDAPAMTAAAPQSLALNARKVSVRELGIQPHDGAMLHPYGGPDTTTGQYRQAESLPMKLMIIDRRIALFPVDPANLDRGYLEISQRPVVDALLTLFEQHWEQATTPMEDPTRNVFVSPREQHVLNLLASGHTDAATARELRISERTVTAIVRSLMDRLGVDNRFQLGIALGTLRALQLPHWTPPHKPAAQPDGTV